MDQKIKLCDLPVTNDLTGLYSINVDANNNPTKTPWAFVQEAIDLKLRALQAVIDNCKIPYVPSVNIDNRNLLTKAYPRLLFQLNDTTQANGAGFYYDIDLEEGHNYTLSVQGCISPACIAKNRYLRVHIEDYVLTDDNEVAFAQDIPLRYDHPYLLGHAFICPKTSHYRISIDICEANGSVATTFDASEYAYLEYIKLEEGAYVTCYADNVSEDINNPNLLPASIEDFSRKKGTLYQREYDGAFMSFLQSKATKANDQFLVWFGDVPEIQRGRSYTLSFMVRGRGSIRAEMYLTTTGVQHNAGCIDENEHIILPAENDAYAMAPVTLTDTYTKHYFTFSINHLPIDSEQIGVLFEFVHKDDECEIRNVKLECGGRATAYIEDDSKSHIIHPSTDTDTDTSNDTNA